jgi:hypothetical protein
MNNAIRTYAKDNGGRVSLLLLLFLLAIYEFISTGFSAFAIICISPLLVLLVLTSFRYRSFLFWVLVVVNYFVQMKNLSLPIPISLANELLELSLLAIALIDIEKSHFERIGNIMFFSILAWVAFCILEVLNDTCGLGINVGAWYSGARLMAFPLLYIFLVFTLYINCQKKLLYYLYVWGALALFAVFWVWRQKYIGLTPGESSWLYGPHGKQHLLQAGTLIRYWSIYSDAANYGIGIASTAVAFVIFGITAKIKKIKYFCLIVGGACIWGMFPSGTRTAIACMMAGFMAYIFLSKSFKIAIPFTLVFGLLVFLLVFTEVGQGNQQIRRMRSAFNKNDASANTRTINQETMKKYMKEAPWGIGIGMNYDNVPANNKYNRMATIAPDSEYVFIWLRTGVVGITVFLICTFIMLAGACWIVFFTLKSPSLRGIGAGFCCAFVSQQVGGYGNQVLMQFPNGLVFYGGLTIVYILPWIEKEWIEWENKALAIQEEKKRLKLEKKRALRV